MGMKTTARFTNNMLATLIHQVRAFQGAGDELRKIQEQGMTVQRILPNGKVNVTWTDSHGTAYRTFSPRDLVIA